VTTVFILLPSPKQAHELTDQSDSPAGFSDFPSGGLWAYNSWYEIEEKQELAFLGRSVIGHLFTN
jgi:hypothetical protein